MSACNKQHFEEIAECLHGFWPIPAQKPRRLPSPRDTSPYSESPSFTFAHIGVGPVDLVNRDDDGHLSSARMVDRFHSLRHDSVIRRHDQDDDIGYLRAARPHGGERFMTGSIQEGLRCGRQLARDRRRYVG